MNLLLKWKKRRKQFLFRLICDDLCLQMRSPKFQPDSLTQQVLSGSPGVRLSALVLCFSDGLNQAACGFILTDLVDGESIHRIDLQGPQVGFLWLIYKPCLF